MLQQNKSKEQRKNKAIIKKRKIKNIDFLPEKV